MCRLDIGMKLPSRSTHDFLTFNFQDVQMPKTSDCLINLLKDLPSERLLQLECTYNA